MKATHSAISGKKFVSHLEGIFWEWLPVLILFLCPALALAQMTPQEVAANPQPLVKRTAENELHASNGGHPYRFTIRKVNDGKITTKEIIETKDGDVARLVAINDKPLNPDQEKTELARLNNLLAHPELQQRRHQAEQKDSARGDEMVRLLPNAFIYHFEGMVQGPNGPAYRLTFKPNPNFNPPDREADVFAGMVGELRVDQKQERIVQIDAHLIRDVDFGWGILGKLYKGGSFFVKQADVGDQHWENTYLKLDLTGVALMFKSLSFQTTEESSDFRPVPPEIDYKQAIKMLEARPPAS